jgi:hypothetical protein
MAASRIFDIVTDSFCDGITGAALFGKLRLPGSPSVLVDTRSPEEAYPEYDALLNAVKVRPGNKGSRMKGKGLDGQRAGFSHSKS